MISYAQNFEDVMLWRALQHVEAGFYIDIGAQDPIVDSVSQAFFERGWRGIHLEPTAQYAGMLRQQRPGDLVIQAAVGETFTELPFFEIPNTGISTLDEGIADQHRERGFDVRATVVPVITLASVLEMAGPRQIHWMKIDVEGYERQVLGSWGQGDIRPWIVVVESTLPLTQLPSHEAWEGLLTSRGYEFAYFDGLNRFYVAREHADLRSAFALPPNVFDGFSLNGTASAPFHRAIQQRLQTQLDELGRHHQSVVTDMERASQAREEALAREQALWKSTEREVHERLTARDREVATLKEEQFQALRRIASLLEDKLALATEHAERERALQAALQTSQQATIDREQASTSREQAVSERLLQIGAEHARQLAEHAGAARVAYVEAHGRMAMAHAVEVRLREEVAGQRAELAFLKRNLVRIRAEIERVYGSWQWRLTHPFHTPTVPRDDDDIHAESAQPPGEGQTKATPGTPPASSPFHIDAERLSRINMSPQNFQPASTLEELLSCWDEKFVHRAYLSILKRLADPGGLSNYVRQIRAGVSKEQIIAELASSDEGLKAAPKLPGLQELLHRQQRRRPTLLGRLLRRSLFEAMEPLTAQLRALENQLQVQTEESQRRFNRLETAVAGLGRGRDEPLLASEVAADDLRHLPERARGLYFQLKAAAALHNGS
jgi:FkbM family methyltransferase